MSWQLVCKGLTLRVIWLGALLVETVQGLADMRLAMHEKQLVQQHALGCSSLAEQQGTEQQGIEPQGYAARRLGSPAAWAACIRALPVTGPHRQATGPG